MSSASNKTLPFSHLKYESTLSYGRPTEINRFGLHALAGVLERDGPDPVTIQILEETNFLPRNVPVLDDNNQAGHGLKAQASRPRAHDSDNGDNSAGTLGLGSLRFSPMRLSRVYGRPGRLPVFNLTGPKTNFVVYAASNVLVYFDYYANTQSILQGHTHKISCLARDIDYKYIATGEMAKNPTIIIWNLKTGFPLKRISYSTVENLSPVRAICFVGNGLDYVGIIQQTEHIQLARIADGDGVQKKVIKQSVSIWFFGEQGHGIHHQTEQHPEAKTDIPRIARHQSKIDFSPDVPHHFVTTGNCQVVFYTWHRSEREISCHIPMGHMKFMKRLKRFTATIWVNDSVLTASASGYIVEWKLQGPLGLEEIPDPDLNVKEFRRFIKIDENVGLTALVAHKGFIVVGDEEGGVRFLDTKFRLLRWTRTGNPWSIRSIAFNHTDSPPEWKIEMRSTYYSAGYDHNTFHRKGNSTVYDYTYGGGNYRIPSKTTIERKPLHDVDECLDMVVGYDNGSVAYFHIAEEKVDTILRETLGPETIVAMDTAPTTKHLAISTKHGAIQVINYKYNEVIQSHKLFKKEVVVTCLKFHPSGAFLVIGTSKGTIYFRRSFTLGLMDNPLHAGKGSIQKIIFSSCGLFMGMFDTNMTVSLCNYNPDRAVWGLRGKHRSHYKPIVDIIFFMDPIVGHQRFFSLGQDKRLIEYDIDQSIATKGLKILTVTSVEQTHLPTALVFDAPFLDHGPLLHYATTNNKIRMFDQDALKIRKTCQGPEYGAPLKHMLSISPESSKGRDTKFILITMGNKIGLMKTPIDGNQYKNMAILGHPSEIQNVGVGSKGSEIFTRAEADECIFMWIPDLIVLENCTMAGGLGVTPFKHALDAGLPPHLSLVRDIEDIFFHLMMKRVKNQQELVETNLTLPLGDIPTVMRTCGHFPSELEIDLLLEEVDFLLGHKFGTKQDEISFEDFLILFANHKDSGIHDDDILHAFEVLGEVNEFDELSISRDKFISLVTTKGEALKEADLPLFLPNFYRDVVRQVTVIPINEPWRLKASIASISRGSESLPSRSVSKVVSEFDGEGSLPLESRDSSVQFQVGTPSNNSLGNNRFSRVFSMSRGESQLPEDSDNWTDHGQEMIEDISVNFFIQQLLPHDVRSAFDNAKNELVDDLVDLERISNKHPAAKPYEAILKRWKGREEWRHFKDMFDTFKHENVPMDVRLAAAMEMDHYFADGKHPERSCKDKDENEESAPHVPIPTATDYQKSMEDVQKVSTEILGEDDGLYQIEDDEYESVYSYTNVEENYGSGSLSSNMEDSESGERQDETVAESDVTQGIPTSRPFTGVHDSDSPYN